MDLLIQIPEKPLMSDEEIICVPKRTDVCCTINMVRNITPLSGEEAVLRQKTVLEDIADVKKSQVQKHFRVNSEGACLRCDDINQTKMNPRL